MLNKEYRGLPQNFKVLCKDKKIGKYTSVAHNKYSLLGK
jgi:hypothetical protein